MAVFIFCWHRYGEPDYLPDANRLQSPAEVRGVVDAKRAGNITTSPQYRVVSGEVGASNDGMFYLNVQSIVAAVRTVLPADARVTFDQQVAPYLTPIQAIGTSAHFFSDHVATSEFVLIR